MPKRATSKSVAKPTLVRKRPVKATPAHVVETESSEPTKIVWWNWTIFWQILPWAIALIVLLIWWKSNQATPDPSPNPEPEVLSIEKATAQIFPSMKAAFNATFEEAAKRVESKQIVNDEQLDQFVNSAIQNARANANKPFDVSFHMSLPRNDDGTFQGKESEAAKFLRQISRSW
jgi:hypothetical protein